MVLWIILGIVWIVVAAAFTIIMGIKHHNEGNEWIDYLAFFICYGILWPVTLPLTGIAKLLEKITDYLYDKFVL